jgi:hypothetical protein
MSGAERRPAQFCTFTDLDRALRQTSRVATSLRVRCRLRTADDLLDLTWSVHVDRSAGADLARTALASTSARVLRARRYHPLARVVAAKVAAHVADSLETAGERPSFFPLKSSHEARSCAR